MPKGTISWFSEEKGFGFLQTLEGNYLLVNYTDIIPNGAGELGFRTLEAGCEVEYEVTKNAHGRQLASGVCRTDSGGSEGRDDVSG